MDVFFCAPAGFHVGQMQNATSFITNGKRCEMPCRELIFLHAGFSYRAQRHAF